VGGARVAKHWIATRRRRGAEGGCRPRPPPLHLSSQVVEAGKAEFMWPEDAGRLEAHARQQLEALVASGGLTTER